LYLKIIRYELPILGNGSLEIFKGILSWQKEFLLAMLFDADAITHGK